MADLNVQPKKKSAWWLWLLLLLVIIALLFYYLRGRNAIPLADTMNPDTSGVIASTDAYLDEVDFNSPETTYEEVTDTSISIRGNDKYAIYGLGENALFSKDESSLQVKSKAQLEQVASSLNKRFKGALIIVIGHTDSTGTAAHNLDLGEERAKAVRVWLVRNANIPEDHISVRSEGEEEPVTSNSTDEGRQQNRSVEIVALKK